MRSLRFRMSAAIALLLATVANSAHADGVVLRYKGTKGQKRFHSHEVELKMTQTIMGKKLKTEFSTQTTSQSEITKVSDKNAITVQQTALKYKMQAELPVVGKYEYDSTSSENESGGQLSSILTPVNDARSGAVVDVTLSNAGKVVKVSGIQDAMKGIVEQFPTAAQFTGGAHTDDGAKVGFEEQFILFPERAVSEGDTWEKPLSMALPSIGKFEGKVVYKYEGTEKVKGRELHKITFTNEMSIDVNQKANGATVTGTMEITSSEGTAWFDAAKGVLVSKESTVTVSGNMNISAGGQDIALQQEQTQVSKAKLLDGPPK